LARTIPDANAKAKFFGGIAQIQARMGDFKAAAANIERALNSAEAMATDFDQFTVYRAISEAQARKGDFEGAIRTAQKIHPGEEGFLRASTIQMIARIQAEDGQVNEAEEWTQDLSFHSDAAWAYLGIAEGLIKQRNPIHENRSEQGH